MSFKKSPALFFILLSNFLFSNEDTLTIKLKLANTNKVLTFNQPCAPDNSIEYLWEIQIDSDNNILTGNSGGFDLGLILLNKKLPGSLSYTGTIISGSDQYSVLYEGNTIKYGNELIVFFGDNDSCLHIKALKNFPEISTITAGSRFFARTLYYSETGLQQDETGIGNLPGEIIDAAGDAAFDFVDILGVFINDLFTDLTSYDEAKNSFRCHPNPTTGKLYFPGNENRYSLLDVSGKILAESITDEIDLINYPEGIYFLMDIDSGITQKIILCK